MRRAMPILAALLVVSFNGWAGESEPTEQAVVPSTMDKPDVAARDAVSPNVCLSQCSLRKTKALDLCLLTVAKLEPEEKTSHPVEGPTLSARTCETVAERGLAVCYRDCATLTADPKAFAAKDEA